MESEKTMDLLEINKEYIFVFKNENIKDRSGIFADTPVKSETIQGVVTAFDSKYITIQTTKESNEIDLRYNTTVQIQLNKLNYWFQPTEESNKPTLGLYIFAFLLTFLFTLIISSAIEWVCGGNGGLSIYIAGACGMIMVYALYQEEQNSESD